jgi:CubicO group peptidase (beta-lactamase class C family)
LARIHNAIPGTGAIKKAPPSLALDVLNPRSRIRRALRGELPEDREQVYARDLEVPSGGGIGTARAIAKAYGVFATGGKELGLRPETLEQLIAPAVSPACGFYDEVMKLEGMELSLGFMKPNKKVPFAHPSSYGMLGFGGSFGFADPYSGLGFAYVPNLNDVYLMDPRQEALRRAMYHSIGISDPFLG